ncbi:hypothetical protein QBC35DRAFT_508634 [Podospora australis]|uniref:Uncharacterized protein n=1 Tax=Podospora australis TaxID=1536484 RepID=A0AAN6WJA0_9PEZI|nr:hypothetical protein QBC35DRAFT_508634 [Podospora australis]
MQGTFDDHGGYDLQSVFDLAQALPTTFLLPGDQRVMNSPHQIGWPPSPAETDKISQSSGHQVQGKADAVAASSSPNFNSGWPYVGDSISIHSAQDMAPDPVCQSIRICPPAKGADDSNAGITPDWTPDRVSILCSISPLIRARVDELRQRPELWWTPVVGDGIDESTALRVLGMVGPGTVRRRQRVSALSQECNVMWAFQINPMSLPASQTWEAVDDDGQLAASKTMVRKTARRSYPASVSSQSTPKWCWQLEPGHRYRLTSLQLANIAMVLQWEEVFKKEIRTVVWDWTGQSQAILSTPVDCLRAQGEGGLDARRKIEKEKVLTHMRDYLERQKNTNKASVKRTYKDLENHSMKLETSSFLHPSIYSMLREIEAAILKEKRPSGGQGPAKTVNPNRPTTPGLLGKIKDMEHSVESLMSGGKAHRKFVASVLSHVHEYIGQQQDILAQEMWKWRGEEMKRWEGQ